MEREILYEQTRILKDSFLELVECVAYISMDEIPKEEAVEIEQILTELAIILVKLEEMLQKKQIPDNASGCQL